MLDLGHALGEEQYEALRLSDQIIAVVRLDVPGLRQTRRLLSALHEQGIPGDRVRLVANRYGQPGQVPWKQAEETLGAPFLEFMTRTIAARPMTTRRTKGNRSFCSPRGRASAAVSPSWWNGSRPRATRDTDFGERRGSSPPYGPPG